ncbi:MULTISPECIES: TetR/AcrR family transcriptional regulator [Brevibacillus]|jgi:AcrR family transcriptional regulator|uniref:Transcriptional regulator n=1 Tax=Brevibacillus borstelensis AK1 TaxID=1300222 RepID=M8DI20_9BACL|nr:TetR/AcrR family transcriptional regulator [Brevibacillus borstelensis]EMT53057.1 transcriptional regulator [Brevibacillus borstelensis AK1]KKX55545.1 transcriptional regulator [Brevibacillus borstelensis cifa_chp40]MBE5397488.1 TetR/AcrR family transcriptional regulator [Brevibacillus borstelensis]MED1747021.1 TetR/AcrR family transcriptional regulator [Brevibacillus borstelensis]MED1883950.1 TetR/AcrR family transcriptional regulator [Brevibacillus borstelensis]
MPRSREENERIRQQTKNSISTAAMEVFLERGYHASSVEDIAKRAGISKGLLYNYYQGKEGLLAEIVRIRTDEIANVIETASALPSPKDQLAHIVEGALSHIVQNPKAYRFLLHLQTQPEEDAVLSKYSQMLNQEMARQFETQCAIFERMEVANPALRSLYFSSALHGVMLLMTVYPGYPVEEVKKQIIKDFCHG